MSSLNFLIRILLILFLIDIIKKIYFKSNKNKLQKNKKENTNNSDINETNYQKNLKEEIDEFSNDNFDENNNKMEFIIKYDRYSHEKDFKILKNIIEKDYKNVNIKGEEYPLPLNKKYFINFTYITQIGTGLLLFFPKYLKFAIPLLSTTALEFIEKYNIILIIGNFLGHMILNYYISKTGAFEVMINNKKIFSKLETNILPDINKLKYILNNIDK